MPTRPICRPSFSVRLSSLYENTRLGRQEIYAEFLETTEGVWFTGFDPARHVSLDAEYHPAYFVRVCDRRRHVAAHGGGVFPGSQPSQLRSQDRDGVWRIPRARRGEPEKRPRDQGACRPLPCHGRIDLVRLDPAASARSSLGPAAYSEYEREFGSRIIGRWPTHLVLDGLDTIENLLDTGDLKIHPRARS